MFIEINCNVLSYLVQKKEAIVLSTVVKKVKQNGGRSFNFHFECNQAVLDLNVLISSCTGNYCQEELFGERKIKTFFN